MLKKILFQGVRVQEKIVMISIDQQEKISKHYKKTGQPELAALQKKSIENSIKQIDRRNEIQRSQNQNLQREPFLKKIVTKYPSSAVVIRLVTLVAVVFVVVVVSNRKCLE